MRGWRDGGTYHIDGRLVVHASPEQAWGVLTDFDHMASFVPSVHRSAVERVTERGLLLRQVLVGKFAFFSRDVTVLLSVREDPYRAIRFRDVLGADFDLYRGFWRLRKAGDDTVLVYELQAVPKERLPTVIGAATLTGEVTQLLTDVAREIDRRARER